MDPVALHSLVGKLYHLPLEQHKYSNDKETSHSFKNFETVS